MKKLTLLFLAIFLTAPLFAKKVVIYHTADSHSTYYPSGGYGGFAALKGLLNQEKNPYLLFDAGDFSDGSLEASHTKGLSSTTIMNALGYDAGTLGNHESYYKDADFINLIKSIKYPVLAANIYDAKGERLLEGVQEYKIFDVDGVKVAVIGIAKDGLKTSFKFKSPVSTVKNVLPKVKAENPDITVLLIHYPVNDARVKKGDSNEIYAKKFPGQIDLVLGGHAHKEVNFNTNGTYFLESGYHLQRAGRAEFDIDDETNKIKSVKTELIPLDILKYGEDVDIKKAAESVRIPGIDTPIGSAEVLLSKSRVNSGCFASPAAQLAADAMLKYVPEADIFAINTPGVRTDIKKGPITKRELMAFFPFDNKIMIIEVDGAFLRRMVYNSITKDANTLFAYSGMEVTFKYKNKKAKELEITVGTEPLDDKKIYKIAMSDYTGNGGSEGWMFKKVSADKKHIFGTKNMPKVLEEYVVSSSPLKASSVCSVQEIK